MFKSKMQRGCPWTSPLFNYTRNTLSILLLLVAFVSCSNEKPQILESRIWHVFEYDTVSKKWDDSLAVQVRLNPGMETRKVKELGIFSSQKELYWVGGSGDFQVINSQNQTWLFMRKLASPAFETVPLGKYDILVETWDADQARSIAELPSSALKRPDIIPEIQNKRIEPLPAGGPSFRELSLQNAKGKEVNRFLLAGPIELSSLQRTADSSVTNVFIQDFYPQDGILVNSGPWNF